MKVSNDLLFVDFTTKNNIIYNYFTNNAIALEKKLANYISNNRGKELENKDLKKEDIEILIRNGILIEDEEDYKIKKYVINGNNVPVNTVYLHVTQRCNLNCVYCYNKRNLNKRDGLSTRDVKHILDELSRNKIKTINFTGGEALIRDDIIEIVKYAKELGFKNVLLTNGTLLGEKREVLEYIDYCIISIDNIDEELNDKTRNGSKRYPLIDILDSIEEAQKDKIAVRSVIMKGQEKNILQNEAFFKEKNIKWIYAACLPNKKEDLKYLPDLNYFVEAVKPDMCGAGKNIIAIDSNGDIYPCQTLVGMKEFYMGNILEDHWEERIGGKSGIINVSVENKEKCKDCEYKFLCLGGCPSVAYKVYGEIHKPNDFLCELYKKNAEEFLKDLFKRKQKNG